MGRPSNIRLLSLSGFLYVLACELTSQIALPFPVSSVGLYLHMLTGFYSQFGVRTVCSC